MSHQQLRFDRVSFYYDSLSEPVFEDLCLDLGPGFTGNNQATSGLSINPRSGIQNVA